MEIFVVLILNGKDRSSTPYWIHADDEKKALRKALRLVGVGDFKVLSVIPLGELVAAGQPKKTKAKVVRRNTSRKKSR